MFRITFIVWLLISGLLLGADSVFEEQVRPILENKCFSCHGPEKQKGKVRLDTLGRDFVNDRRAAETWHDALDAINLGEMPPEEENPIDQCGTNAGQFVDRNESRACQRERGFVGPRNGDAAPQPRRVCLLDGGFARFQNGLCGFPAAPIRFRRMGF